MQTAAFVRSLARVSHRLSSPEAAAARTLDRRRRGLSLSLSRRLRRARRLVRRPVDPRVDKLLVIALARNSFTRNLKVQSTHEARIFTRVKKDSRSLIYIYIESCNERFMI